MAGDLTITVTVATVPDAQRYRTRYGDLPAFVSVRLHDMVVPVAHCPSRTKADLVAAALTRWADEDPRGLSVALWTIRDHQ